jgi:uncharacterized phage protein (TIGR02218 family)
MSYEGREESRQDGTPRELYRFTLGGQAWTYASGDDEIAFNSETYTPEPIERTEPEQSRERGRAGIVITVARDLPVAQLFIGSVPSRSVGVTIFRLHADDGEVIDFWTGRVRSCERAEGMPARLNCETNSAMLQRLGLRARHQSTCNVPLYSRRCGVLKTSFASAGPVTSITGAVIVSSAFFNTDPLWFKGGMVERANGDLRTIEAQGPGGALTLKLPFEGLQLGEVVTAYAGCDHLFATCSSAKFADFTDDGEAFAGCPTIPEENPHDTGLR